MSFWVGVLVLAVGLVISIALHEIGHMLPAKKFGVKVTEFFVGFGPTAWVKRRGETLYGFKWIPLGGFVRMIGMYPSAKALGLEDSSELSEESRQELRSRRSGISGWAQNLTDDVREIDSEAVSAHDEDRTFYSLSVPKKLVVMAGGPLMNLLISTVLLAFIISGLGIGTTSNKLSSVAECIIPVGESRECTDEDPVAPGYAAGLHQGDQIVSWDGQEISHWDDISQTIAAGGTDPVQVLVERDDALTTLTITPALTARPVTDDSGAVVVDEDGNLLTAEAPFIGISPQWEQQRRPLTEVPGYVGNLVSGTFSVIINLPQRLIAIASSTFGGQERDPSIMGLIGVGRVAGEIASVSAAEYGFKERLTDLLSLIASLNMALFAFNMIPLLPLDGGHIAGALFEGIRRRISTWRGRGKTGPADTAKLMPLTYVVFGLLLGMTLLLAIADIVNPVSLLG